MTERPYNAEDDELTPAALARLEVMATYDHPAGRVARILTRIAGRLELIEMAWMREVASRPHQLWPRRFRHEHIFTVRARRWWKQARR